MNGNSGTAVRPIAIIGGTGQAGAGLALRWARAGETIIIGSRDEERAQQTAAAIQKKAGANANVAGMENSAACAAADILVLTVPFEGQAPLLKQLKPAMTEAEHTDRRHRSSRRQRRRTRLPHPWRLARFGRSAGRRTCPERSERCRRVPQSFRRSTQRRRATRLRCHRVQR